MKAMILAAGRGERMRPLTDTTPKPLLAAGGKPLIVWHIERLALAGLQTLIINHAHLGAQIESYLGDGRNWGVQIRYSPEPGGALETAGGIRQALPLLGDDPFLVINGDVFCDWDFRRALELAPRLSASADQAHLVLVPNPDHHPRGDFDEADGRCHDRPALTFSGIGLYHPTLFTPLPLGEPARLAPLLRSAMTQDRVSAERHPGLWLDIGTPQRLAELDATLRRS